MTKCTAGYVLCKDKLHEFKTSYYTAPDGSYDFEIQVEHLAKLADGYYSRYQTTHDWTDILKAHSLYNSVAVRTATDKQEGNKKIFEVQLAFWGKEAAWKYETQQWVTEQLRDELKNIRKDIRSQLIPVDQLVKQLTSCKLNEIQFLEKFNSKIQQISLNCTDRMVSLAKTVFEFSVSSLITLPPCPFCVVAFGSMAKGEATPYSDLEYLFLIEREDSNTMEYFEKLAMSSYFLIGNLKETKLSYMAIAELEGWFADKQMNGFKIDGLQGGAGNIPTGNGSTTPNNHLIGTPIRLLSRYKTVLDDPKDEAIGGDFTAMLQYTKLIYCSEKCAERLLDEFSEGKNLLFPNAERKKANKRMFIADAKKYSFKPTEKLINNGFSINTKRELYRYPSILLYNLSILFGSNQCDSWETLQNLHSQNFISESVYTSVSFLLACACYFRLSTYLYYDTADDRLSVLPTNYFPATNNEPLVRISEYSGQRWFLPQQLFNMHCDYSIPLKSHIGLCSTDDIEEIIRSEIEESNWLIKFQTYHCCNRWSKGQRHFHEHISELSVLQRPDHTVESIYKQVKYDFHELWNSVKALTYSLCENRKDKEALSYHLAIQEMIKTGNGRGTIKEQQLILADSKAEAAECHYGLTKFREASEEYVTTLKIRCKYLKRNDELLAKMHFGLGKCYNMMHNYKEAENELLKSLELCHNNASSEVTYNYYGDVVHTEETPQHLVELLKKTAEEKLICLNNPTIILAHVIWTLGLTYFYSRNYQRAFLYFDKSRKMFLELYGNEACHRDIAYILYALACTCDRLEKYDDTTIYFRRSLDMILQLYGKKSKLCATVLHVLAIKCSAHYQSLMVKIFLSLPRFQIVHSETATVVSRFGFHLANIGKHELAGFVLNKALNMYKKVFVENRFCFSYISTTLSHMAFNQWKMGNIASAEKLYLESIQIVKENDHDIPESAALMVGETLQSLGNMYEQIERYETALKFYQDANEKFHFCCDDSNHPKILETENQIRLTQLKVNRQSKV